jgi:EcoRII C terminal
MPSLSALFTGTACKYLSRVDANAQVSNQHEIGSNKFIDFLGNPGSSKQYFDAIYVLFDSNRDEPDICEDTVTWYDTRLNQPHRAAEYRLYYRDNVVTEQMLEGDFCLVGRLSNGKVLIALARPGSEDEYRLRHLFELEVSERWSVSAQVRDVQINLAYSQILSALGIELPEANDIDVEKIIHVFNGTFPTTKAFSSLARKSLEKAVSARDDPDDALERWMQFEERMFRALEKVVVQKTLDKKFEHVDAFISFSLSVQNRRKSRAGHALENHLSAVFEANEIAYIRGAQTENRSKPDFLFPDLKSYQDLNVSSPPLRMLAAKTTCKDRWRQILSEAARIPEKHLFTLETAISGNQMQEMSANRVVLVTTPSIRNTYQKDDQGQVLSLADFIRLV